MSLIPSRLGRYLAQPAKDLATDGSKMTRGQALGSTALLVGITGAAVGAAFWYALEHPQARRSDGDCFQK